MSLSAHVQAVADHLNADGIPTGRGKRPAGGGWVGAPGQSEFAEYAIVWRVGGKDFLSSDIDQRFDERRPQIHVRTVGGTQTEADVLLDAVNESLTVPLVVPGFDLVHFMFDTSIGAAKDDDVTPPVFYTGAYWRFWTQETA